MSQFKNRASEDKRVRLFEKRFTRGVYVIDTEQLLNELTQLHETRYFRAYKTSEVIGSVQNKLLRADIQNAAYRSRAVAIKMRCFRIFKLLEEDVNNVSNYISTKYVLLLKNEFTIKDDRTKAVKDLLREPVSMMHKIQVVMDFADILIRDLDAEAWSIERAIEIFKLSVSKKRNI